MVMPDNAWITPFVLPDTECLSLGASQGIVYALDDRLVIKLPFQYLAGHGSIDEPPEEYLALSLRSLACVRKESYFYDLLARNPHPNITRRIADNNLHGLILERVRSIEDVWPNATRARRHGWIIQLLDALTCIEHLGYTHGDISIRNIGIDSKNCLQLYDFGSVVGQSDDWFSRQHVEDHSALASAIHFIASGVDPLAQASSLSDLKRIRSQLELGTFNIHDDARDFECILRPAWMKATPTSSFHQVRNRFASIIEPNASTSPSYSTRPTSFAANTATYAPNLIKDSRWMDEQEYCTAWEAKGYQLPTSADIS